jgi:hypothetical protein
MRSDLGFCVVLTATLAWAGETTLLAQQPDTQPPIVSTPVPNINAPGAAALTNPSPPIPQTTATVPAGTSATTTSAGNSVAAQPGATTTVPSNGMTNYYYYPARNSGMMFTTAAPGTYYYYTTASTPAYTAPAQAYYTPVRRGFPFGLFRRRFAQPMTPTYTTATITPAPAYYYTNPGYYAAPGTYNTVPAATLPSGTSASGVPSGTAAPVYTPTTYTAPSENLPVGTTAPLTTTPAGGATSSRIPAPPPVNPK